MAQKSCLLIFLIFWGVVSSRVFLLKTSTQVCHEAWLFITLVLVAGVDTCYSAGEIPCFIEDQLYYPQIYASLNQTVSFCEVFRPKFCVNFISTLGSIRHLCITLLYSVILNVKRRV
jgi:hypothetical protein